jgi:hypothetical protein
MAYVGGTPLSPQEDLLGAVSVEAQRLAGEGKKIKYTHVLDAFRTIYGTNERFKNAFERVPPVSTDLERAEALATLVENVAKLPDAGPSVQVVGHALRRWSSLGAETKGKIDQVFQNQVLQGKRWARFKDKATEFFRDLGTLITRSRLSTEADKAYADKVCQTMEKSLSIGAKLADIVLPEAKNRTQKAFLNSAKELYLQRLPSAKTEREEQQRTLLIVGVGTKDVERMNPERIDERISYLNKLRLEKAITPTQQSLIDRSISQLQLAKAAKYFDMFVANTSIQQTGNDAARAEARGNAKAALMRLRDEVGADSHVGQDITKKLVEISRMEEHETRLQEQKKR